MDKDQVNFIEVLRDFGLKGIPGGRLYGPGFSFGYGEDLNRDWKRPYVIRASALVPGERYDTLTVTYAHRVSAFEIDAQYKLYKAHKVCELNLTFRNAGAVKLNALKDLRVLDLDMDLSACEEPIVHNIGAGACPWIFPPTAYRHTQVEIYPDLLNPRRVPYWPGSISFANARINEKDSYTGGSLPFVFLNDREKTGGLYLALGWEGDWKITVHKNFDSLDYNVNVAVPDINISLYPGESISGPSVFLGEFAGDWSDGSNALRAFISDEFMRNIPMKNGVPPVTYNHWFGYGLDINDKLMRAVMDKASGVGAEYFIIDSGWYPGVETGPGGYLRGMGNWRADTVKFPQGMKAMSDYAHSKGMKYGEWIAPEKMWFTSATAKKHPDLVLTPPESGPRGLNPGIYLMNMAKQEARDFYKKTAAWAIEEHGLDWIRLEPFPGRYMYWQKNDTESDRKGATMFHYCAGLREAWGWIRENYPDVVIELLAPTLLNMDVFRYADQSLVSDMNMNANVMRGQFHGLNRIIPGSYVCGMFVPSTLDYEDYPDYYYHSFFGCAFQINEPLTEWSPERLEKLAGHMDVYKRVRPYMKRDFYLPFGEARTLEEWQGWQYHDPDADAGAFTVFRTRAKDACVSLPFGGISAGKTYVVEDPYSGKTEEYSGEALLGGALRVELEVNGSKVLSYRAK